ncbi:MAG: DUF1003 domain-containing protein [Candidatus Velthaea sp.]|jgi:uncharacterized membrane protein
MNPTASSQSLHGGAHETIESVADLDRGAERALSLHQRWIERTTSAVGRPRTVYVVLAFTAVWIAVNSALAPSRRAFDPPPFAYLDCIISLAALLMTIIILTTENRINLHDTRRDRLDLQINLLNERKISKVIELLEALRSDSPAMPDRHDPEASEMRHAADTAAIVRAIDERTPDAAS